MSHHCHVLQPYVTIGALTTRNRAGTGIKDSQENITDTRYCTHICSVRNLQIHEGIVVQAGTLGAALAA